MSIKTKIDWCDSTWSPVTGCLHGCEYCYARRIAQRFGGVLPEENPGTVHITPCLEPIVGRYFRRYELDSMQARRQKDGKIVPAYYPFCFAPTFHKYRLGEILLWQKPRNIFVGSMCDLFGNWVPDEWITEVFNACRAAPQHRYLFLTKNPHRYLKLAFDGLLPVDSNFWYGTSITGSKDGYPFIYKSYDRYTFVSLEPLLEDVSADLEYESTDWIIIGAETGNRKGKVIPEKEWITRIADESPDVPIFMKESLRGIMGTEFRQEFPW